MYPDDKYLVVRDNVTNYDANLYLINTETGEELHLTPHDGIALYYGAAWTPDSKGFYFTTDQDREFHAIAYYDIEEGRFSWFETPDWNVQGLSISEDGRFIAWTTNEDGYGIMHIRDLSTGNDLLPPPLPLSLHLGALAGDLGCFPFGLGTYLPKPDSRGNSNGIRSLFGFGNLVGPLAQSVLYLR